MGRWWLSYWARAEAETHVAIGDPLCPKAGCVSRRRECKRRIHSTGCWTCSYAVPAGHLEEDFHECG
jgi:hypothetical protein